jgi:hypothetical protein
MALEQLQQGQKWLLSGQKTSEATALTVVAVAFPVLNLTHCGLLLQLYQGIAFAVQVSEFRVFEASTRSRIFLQCHHQS